MFFVTEVQDECENDGFIVDGDEDEEESKEDDEKRDRKKWKKKRLIIFLNKQLILSR